MKRYLKYIIPAVAVLLVAVAVVLFVFFFKKDKGEEPSKPDETEPPEVLVEELPDFDDYFLLKNDAKSLMFSNISQYEGEVVALDSLNYLLAIKTQDLNTRNQVTDTVRVYDAISGEVIFTESVSYDLDSAEWTDLSLEIDYPILKVVMKENDATGVSDVSVSYYLAKKDGELLAMSSAESEERTDFGNGLSAFRLGDRAVWINRDLEIVRSVSDIAVDGYDTNVFQSEYHGYLYTWNSREAQIFNRLGLCSGTYSMDHDGYIRAHVLNNGNLLIQDFEAVSASDAYDVILNNTRYRVKSFMMNLVDGSLKQMNLGFIVERLETAYAQKYGTEKSSLPFKLAKGRENQAIIYRYANGTVSLYQEYVVLSNALQVEYTVMNQTLGLDFTTAKAVGSELYSAVVSEGGGTQTYLFDLKGNVISPVGGSVYVTDSYLVTASGTYNHKMERLLDLQNGEFGGALMGVDVANDRIYLTKHNFMTHGKEVYVYTAEKTQPTLLSDGIHTTVQKAGNGYYLLKDETTDQYCFYDLTGEARLVVWKDYQITVLNEGLLVETEFEGRDITYVIR